MQNEENRYWYEMGCSADKAGDRVRAIECLRNAIGRFPNHAPSHFRLGNCLFALGKAEALAEYITAINLDPVYSFVLSARGGNCLPVDGGEESARRAIPFFKAALELDPLDASAWEGLGEAYLRLRRFDESVSALKKAESLSPHFFTVVSIGMALEGLGDIAGRDAAYRRGLEILDIDPTVSAEARSLEEILAKIPGLGGRAGMKKEILEQMQE